MDVLEPTTITGAGGVMVGLAIMILRDTIRTFAQKRNGSNKSNCPHEAFFNSSGKTLVRCVDHESLLLSISEIRNEQQEQAKTLSGIRESVRWLVQKSGGPK